MIIFVFFAVAALAAGIGLAHFPGLKTSTRIWCFALLHIIPTLLWCIATVFKNSFDLGSIGISLYYFGAVWGPFVLAPSSFTFLLAMAFKKGPEDSETKEGMKP